MVACSRPESMDRGESPLPAGDDHRPAVAAGAGSCLAFCLGDTELALPLADVRETGQLAAVAPLPNLPGWIRGILHRRGEILSVVDLAAFLGLPTSQWAGPGQPYLLFRQPDFACCLAVARVGAVVHPEDRESVAPEAEPSGSARLAGLISGMCRSAGRDIPLLDSELLATALRCDNPRPGPERRAATDGSRGEGQ